MGCIIRVKNRRMNHKRKRQKGGTTRGEDRREEPTIRGKTEEMNHRRKNRRDEP
jgi:hypothetical protein